MAPTRWPPCCSSCWPRRCSRSPSGRRPRHWAASPPASSGSAPCWPRCCRSTGCSAPISRMARSTSCCCAACRQRRSLWPRPSAHWLVTGLPLLLAAAPLAVMLRMPDWRLPALLAGLLPGTMLLSLLGTAGRRDRARRPPRRGAAAAAGPAARDAGADFRCRRGRRRVGGLSPRPASAAARGPAGRRPAALPAGRRGRACARPRNRLNMEPE